MLPTLGYYLAIFLSDNILHPRLRDRSRRYSFQKVRPEHAAPPPAGRRGRAGRFRGTRAAWLRRMMRHVVWTARAPLPEPPVLSHGAVLREISTGRLFRGCVGLLPRAVGRAPRCHCADGSPRLR